MALSHWAENLIPELTKQLGTVGVQPGAVIAFAAQLDIETAGGTSALYKRTFNVAGIGGRGNYRTYPNLAEGLRDYVELLSRRYKPTIQAGGTGDPIAVALALGASPWAAHRYRLGSSSDEVKGSSGRFGTEGYSLIVKWGGTPPGSATSSSVASTRLRTTGTAGTIAIPTEDEAASLLGVEAFGLSGLAGVWTAGNVDLATTMVSEVTLTFHDEQLKIASTLNLRDSISWGQWPLEIAALEIGPGPSGTGQVTVTARSALAQTLRHTRPKHLSYPNRSVSQLMAQVLGSTGRNHTIQDTPVQTQVVVNTDETTGEVETWWDAFQRWAQDSASTGGTEFVCYEAAGTIYFGTPTWLVGNCPVLAVTVTFDADGQPLLDDGLDAMPTIRRTVDDPDSPVEVTLTVRPQLGARIMPGMALNVTMPAGVGVFLVSSVRGPLSAVEPWTVTAVLPQNRDIDSSDTASVDSTGTVGGADAIGADSADSNGGAGVSTAKSVAATDHDTRSYPGGKPSARGWGNPGTPGSAAGKTFASANLVTVTAAGIRFTLHKRVAPVLVAFINDMDKLVPGGLSATGGDDGGYNHRWIIISGKAQVGNLSTHSWGITVDLDWRSNPQGPRRTTFPETKVNNLISGKYRNLIFWGLYFNLTADAMHFEFVGTPEQAEQLAKTL